MRTSTNEKHTSRTLKELLGVVAAGVLAAAPLTTLPTTSQAAPYGARQNQNREYRTLTGVVVNDRQGRNFVMRANSGERIRVQLDEREPRRLSVGDEVRVTGYFNRNNRNVFFADNLQILSNQRGTYGNNYQTFTGRVTNVTSNERFSIRSGNTIYNVLTTTRLPRRLNAGDMVRVYGIRSGANNIINATVAILNNQNNNNNYGNNYNTYVGRVTNVDSDERFDIVVGNTTYNVITTTRLPRRLNRGDTVRVYGLRSGENNIINASVVILSNGGYGNNNNYNDYRTFLGRVTNVDSDERFDIVVGNTTYNVITSTRLPRRLNRGDYVRVYGVRSGENNIINASVAIISNR